MIRVRAKTVMGKSWTPKTERNRAVPISRALRKILDGYVVPLSQGKWYFPSPEGHWWDPDNYSRTLASENAKAGYTWGCDEYRHTFGSHLAMRGESLYKISQMMGNSPEICRKHYAALLPESLIDSVEFFPDEELPPQTPAPPEQPPEGERPKGRPLLRLVSNKR